MTAPLSAKNPSYRSVYRAGLFEGEVVIVTGGGSGIGRCTAHELASLVAVMAPVRVNAVAPGWIASSGMDHYGPDMRAHIRGLHQHVPLGRLGTESEVSAAIVFLLSPAAAFVSGSCLRVDGAVPNTRRSSPLAGKSAKEPFNAFLLAQNPKVLDQDD